MDAKELRLGSLILYEGKEKKVIALAKNNIVIKGFGGDDECFKSILLTEEMLLKLGFVLHNELVYIFKHHARIRITKKFELLLDGNLWIKLEYVHQLQNLYFALTNTEL